MYQVTRERVERGLKHEADRLLPGQVGELAVIEYGDVRPAFVGESNGRKFRHGAGHELFPGAGIESPRPTGMLPGLEHDLAVIEYGDHPVVEPDKVKRPVLAAAQLGQRDEPPLRGR